MKKRAVFSLLAVLLWAVLDFSIAENITAYFKDGGNLELRPTFSDPITNILWKFDKYLIAEWLIDGVNPGVPLHYYDRFKGRATLDTTSGVLVMKNLNTSDEGNYTVEINNKVQPQCFIGKLIKVVPKPNVWVQPLKCSTEMDGCTLKCEKGIEEIKDAEPIYYEWRKDNGEWQPKGTTIQISKTADANIKTFTCKMKNPVSEEESDPYENIFYKEPTPVDMGTAVGLPVALVLLGLLGILGFVFREKIKDRFNKRQDEGDARAANGRNPGSPSDGSHLPLNEHPGMKAEA